MVSSWTVFNDSKELEECILKSVVELATASLFVRSMILSNTKEKMYLSTREIARNGPKIRFIGSFVKCVILFQNLPLLTVIL